jgi:hypothetical protein
MRFVVIIVAALMILGLAAFGLASAQKGSRTATAASTVRVASATRNVPALPARTQLSQIAQAAGSETPVSAATTPSRPPAALPAAAPTRLAQTTPAQTSSAASAPAPNAATCPIVKCFV